MRLMPSLLVLLQPVATKAAVSGQQQDTGFQNLGGDHYTSHNPERTL